jgi:glycosyltransferase involved in cell wall biosynthesis
MSVRILMATYNGEKYIESQIKSIIEQTSKDWELWIRDDASSDNTIEIIQKYAEIDTRIKFINPTGERLGVLGNFSKLLSFQHENLYFMFCDQDDIWVPEKIELSLTILNHEEKIYGKKTPILIHTDLRMINSEDNIISKSFFKNQKINKSHPCPLSELIFENYVTGCTVLFNKSLLDVAMPLPKKIIMHDWWFALVAASMGRIVTSNEVTVNYRQHSNNVVGAGKSNKFGLLFGWGKLRSQLSFRIEQLDYLRSRLEKNIIDKKNYDFICTLHKKIKDGGLFAAIWLIQRKIRLQSKSRTLSFYLLVLTKSL